MRYQLSHAASLCFVIIDMALLSVSSLLQQIFITAMLSYLFI
jgi:hypothetical protein